MNELAARLQKEPHYLTLMIILDSQSEKGAKLSDDERVRWIVDRVKRTEASHFCLASCSACDLEFSYKTAVAVWDECDVFFPIIPDSFNDKLHFITSLYMSMDVQWIEYDNWFDSNPLTHHTNCMFMKPISVQPTWSIEQIYEYWLTLPDQSALAARATAFIEKVKRAVSL